MSIWTLSQVVFNLLMAAGFFAMWWRLRRPPQDDPRLSRGLQLLQTKITVLEDLSDRTDAQVKQLSGLLDHKTRIVQNKILEAEQQMLKIDHSMNKSLEVAEIFQDKIPHQEILERQRTVEYVKAARMAHSGLSVEEIAESVHLPREQIELIAKFNRDQLMFDERSLPAWATRESDDETSVGAPAFTMERLDFVHQLETDKADVSQMEEVQTDFKQAVQRAKEQEAAHAASLMESRVAETVRSSLENMQPAVMTLKATAQTFKDRLVSTAEDLLRAQAATVHSSQQSAEPTVAPVAPRIISQSPQHQASQAKTAPIVRKVIFPKIDRAP